MKSYFLIAMKDPNTPPLTDPFGELIPLDEPGHHIYAQVWDADGAPNIDHDHWTMVEYATYKEMAAAARTIIDTLP